MDYVRVNFRRMVPGLPAACEAQLLAARIARKIEVGSAK
jgi:hypothetical protein